MDIKVKAKSFTKEFKLDSSKILSFEELSKIAVNLQFKVYCTNDMNDMVLKKLNICEIFQEKSAFTYCKGEVKYIFIHSDIPNEVIATLLLHELAHIYLGHMEKSTIPAKSDEAEANLFVSYVLKEVFNKRTKPTILNVVLFAISVVMLISAVYIVLGKESLEEFDLTMSIATNTIETKDNDKSEVVVVTKTGEKYHKPNCYHIIDSEAIKLTISEAEAAGYEPCKDCFPNGE